MSRKKIKTLKKLRMVKKMHKKIKLKDAKCTKLSLSAPVSLLKKEDDKNNFLIEAYTGEMVERWWGWLAIDLDGLTARDKIPILKNHDRDKIVGYSNSTYTDQSFFVKGRFSQVTDVSKEVKGLADEGFPWQASIGVQPLKIIELERGAKEVVNGKTVRGPAQIWLESEVFETSFVPLGADDNTAVTTFSKFDEAPQGVNINIHDEENFMDITLEKLEKDAPALLEKIKQASKAEGLAEGEKAGAEKVLALAKVHFSDGEKFEVLAKSGVTVEQYEAIKALQPEKKEETEDMKAKILAGLESDQVGNLGAGGVGSVTEGPIDFMAAWKGIKKEKGCSSREAMSKAAKEFPELYKKHAGGK